MALCRLRSSRKAQPEEQKTFENWIVFSVSNCTLALPVSHVREILRLEGLTGVPNVPQPVAGVMNLRGHVLPVVDTHALLGLPRSPVTDASRVLIFLLNNGRDGAAGLAELTRLGAHAIAQDRKSSIVFGMPKAAIEHGSVAEVLPLSDIGPRISDLLRAGEIEPRPAEFPRSG